MRNSSWCVILFAIAGLAFYFCRSPVNSSSPEKPTPVPTPEAQPKKLNNAPIDMGPFEHPPHKKPSKVYANLEPGTEFGIYNEAKPANIQAVSFAVHVI